MRSLCSCIAELGSTSLIVTVCIQVSVFYLDDFRGTRGTDRVAFGKPGTNIFGCATSQGIDSLYFLSGENLVAIAAVVKLFN